MAELTLISNKSAASRRDAPASTVPITRSRRSPEYDCGIVAPHRRINANRLPHLNGLGNPPIPLDSDSAESAVSCATESTRQPYEHLLRSTWNIQNTAELFRQSLHTGHGVATSRKATVDAITKGVM